MHPSYIKRSDAYWLGHWPVSMHLTQYTAGVRWAREGKLLHCFLMEFLPVFCQKVVFTPHFTISFELWFVGALEVPSPLDFHQLILGDSVDDS